MKFTSAVVLSIFSAAALAESITTVITATKEGHVYTKTVVQDATFVWTGEGDSTWSYSASSAASSAASSEAPVSSAASSSEVTSTTVSSSTIEASTTSEIASYTGAAGALTVGGGFMGVAVAAALML